MDDKLKKIIAAWLAVFGAMALTCGGPSGGPTGNCEEEPATNPGKVNEGDLKVTVGQVEYVEPTGERSQLLSDAAGDSSSSDVTADTTASDASPTDASTTDTLAPDAQPADVSTGDTIAMDILTGDTSVDAAIATDTSPDDVAMDDASTTDTITADTSRADTVMIDATSGGDTGSGPTEGYYAFTALDEDDPAFEVVFGVQGGTHIEPALLVENVDSEEFDSTIKFQLRDPETDEVLTHTACQKGDEGIWDKRTDGWLYHGIRVIFSDSRPDEVTFIADIQIDDERKVVKKRVSLR